MKKNITKISLLTLFLVLWSSSYSPSINWTQVANENTFILKQTHQIVFQLSQDLNDLKYIKHNPYKETENQKSLYIRVIGQIENALNHEKYKKAIESEIVLSQNKIRENLRSVINILIKYTELDLKKQKILKDLDLSNQKTIDTVKKIIQKLCYSYECKNTDNIDRKIRINLHELYHELIK